VHCEDGDKDDENEDEEGGQVGHGGYEMQTKD